MEFNHRVILTMDGKEVDRDGWADQAEAINHYGSWWRTAAAVLEADIIKSYTVERLEKVNGEWVRQAFFEGCF